MRECVGVSVVVCMLVELVRFVGVAVGVVGGEWQWTVILFESLIDLSFCGCMCISIQQHGTLNTHNTHT